MDDLQRQIVTGRRREHPGAFEQSSLEAEAAVKLQKFNHLSCLLPVIFEGVTNPYIDQGRLSTLSRFAADRFVHFLKGERFPPINRGRIGGFQFRRREKPGRFDDQFRTPVDNYEFGTCFPVVAVTDGFWQDEMSFAREFDGRYTAFSRIRNM